MAKPKIAFYWCSSCGGCEESVIDLSHRLLEIADLADIVFWPAVLDTKYHELRHMADGSLAVSFINGSIRMKEHEEMVRLLRRKSKLIMAHGACAHLGGIYGLGNLFSAEELIKGSYEVFPSLENTNGTSSHTTLEGMG